jgi:hypothetical protein
MDKGKKRCFNRFGIFFKGKKSGFLHTSPNLNFIFGGPNQTALGG